jgi:multicomponent Na+:H+ antiporter subunit G
LSVVADIFSWIFILLGSGFLLIGAIGLIRFPDVYSRMHAAGITDTLGVGLMIVGMIFQAGLTLVSVKLALIILFMFFASPTATHALAQAALGSGLKPKLAEDRTTGPPEKESEEENEEGDAPSKV